jgi:hypothetical protein
MVTKYTLEDFEFIAASLGGKLDSNKFDNYDSKLDWECSLGHKFIKAPSTIINRLTWCLKCKRGIYKKVLKKIIGKLKETKKPNIESKYSEKENKTFFEEFQNELNRKMEGAKLRDDNIFNGKDEFYNILCPIGHKTKVTYNQTVENTVRCGSCIQITEESSEKLNKMIELKKGNLLTSYKGDKTKVTIQCENKHIWEVIPNNVKKGSWCPKCIIPVNEERCRIILNYLLDSKLEKIRPGFLYYEKTGKNLELDGYDEKLQLAFEYNGIQHYEEMYFDTDNERLSHQQRKDLFKQNKCKELDIVLLNISYEYVKVKKDDVVINYLAGLLKKHDIEVDIKKKNDLLNQDLSQMMPYHTRGSLHKEFATKECLKRGGKILNIDEITISTNKTKFNVECSFGHVFETYTENLKDKRGRWCSKCKTDMVVNKAAFANVNNLHKEYVHIVNIERNTICEVFCLNCGIIYNDISFADVKHHCNQKESYELDIYDCKELEGFKIVNFETMDKYKYLLCPNYHIRKVEKSKINKFTCRECYFKRERDHLKRINFSLIGKSNKSDAVIIKCNTCSCEVKTYRAQIIEVQHCRFRNKH